MPSGRYRIAVYVFRYLQSFQNETIRIRSQPCLVLPIADIHGLLNKFGHIRWIIQIPKYSHPVSVCNPVRAATSYHPLPMDA
jgi:hypothetical protein